jgi:hypothetical protein
VGEGQLTVRDRRRADERHLATQEEELLQHLADGVLAAGGRCTRPGQEHRIVLVRLVEQTVEVAAVEELDEPLDHLPWLSCSHNPSPFSGEPAAA